MANFNETLQKFSESNKTAEIQIKGQDRPLEVNMVDKKFTAADKEAQNAQERGEKERTALLQDIAAGISNMTKSLVEGLKKLTDPALMGLGLLAGLLLAPLVVLASFFKQLAVEVKFFAGLIGKLGGIFKPIKNLFTFLTGLTLGWVDELKNLKIFEKIKSLFTFLKGIGLSFVDTLADLKIFDRLKTLFSFLKGLGLSFVDTLGDLKIFERLKTLFAFFKGIGLTFVDTLADLKIFERLKTLFAFFKGLGLTFIDTLADLKIFDRLKTLFSFLKGIGLGFVDTLADIKVFDKIQTLFAYIRSLGTKLEFVKDLANITFDKIKLVYNFFKNVAKSLTFFDNIDLTPATKAIQAFRKAFDVVKGGIVGIGGILDTIGVIVKSGVEKVAKAFATSISVIMKGFDIAKSVFSTIGGLLRGLGSIITVGIGVVVKAFVIGAAGVSKTFDIIKSVFGTIGALLRGIGSIISFGVGAVSKAFALSVTIVTGAFTVIRGVFSTVGSLLRGIASIVQFGVSTVVTAFGVGVKLIMGAFSVIKTGFTIVGGLAKGVGAVIGLVTSGVSKLVGGIFKIVGFVFSMVQSIGKVASASASFMKLFGPIFNFAAGIGTTLGKIFLPISILMGIFDFVSGFIDGYSIEGTPAAKITNGIKEGLVSLFDGIFGMPLRMIGAGIAIVANYLGFDFGATIEQSINAFVENVKDFIRKGFDLIKGLITGDVSFSDILNRVSNLLKDLVEGVWNWFKGIFKFTTSFLPSGTDNVLDILQGLVNGAWKWFKGLFLFTASFLPAGTDNVLSILKGLVEGTWKWFKGLFQFTTSFLPEGTDRVVDIIKGLADGLWSWFKGLFLFTENIITTADAIKPVDGVVGIIKGLAEGLWGWFKGLFQFTADTTKLADVMKPVDGVAGILRNLVQGAFNYLKSLFVFGKSTEDTAASLINVFFFPWNLVATLVEGAYNYIKGLFGFDTSKADTATADSELKTKGIGGLIVGLLTSAWNYISAFFGFGSDKKSEVDNLTASFSLVTLASNVVKDVFNAATSKFDEFVASLKTIPIPLPSIDEILAEIPDMIDVFEPIRKFFLGIEEWIASKLEFFSKPFEVLGDGITATKDVIGNTVDVIKEKSTGLFNRALGAVGLGDDPNENIQVAGELNKIGEQAQRQPIPVTIMNAMGTSALSSSMYGPLNNPYIGSLNSGVGRRTLSMEEFAGVTGMQPQTIILDQSTVTNNDNAPSIQAIAPTTTENQDGTIMGFIRSVSPFSF